MSNKQFRIIVRWAHIIVPLFIGTYMKAIKPNRGGAANA